MTGTRVDVSVVLAVNSDVGQGLHPLVEGREGWKARLPCSCDACATMERMKAGATEAYSCEHDTNGCARSTWRTVDTNSSGTGAFVDRTPYASSRW